MPDASPTCDADPRDPALDRAERRLARLDEVADLALELARAVQRRALDALAEPPAEKRPAEKRLPGPDPVVAFARAARAVRLTVHLQARLEAEVKALRDEAQARATAQAQRPAAAPSPAAARKEQLLEHVGEVIDAEVEDGREARIAYLDLIDRIETEADEAWLVERPLGVVIADICSELGLTPDWSLWADDDWAIEETRAAAPGSPYAAPPYRDRDPESARPEEAPAPPPERFKLVASLGP